MTNDLANVQPGPSADAKPKRFGFWVLPGPILGVVVLLLTGFLCWVQPGLTNVADDFDVTFPLLTQWLMGPQVSLALLVFSGALLVLWLAMVVGFCLPKLQAWQRTLGMVWLAIWLLLGLGVLVLVVLLGQVAWELNHNLQGVMAMHGPDMRLFATM